MDENDDIEPSLPAENGGDSSESEQTLGAGIRRWIPLILIAATLLFYASSCRGPFIFDDKPAILENPTIGRLSTAFSPPPQTTVAGRPVVNITLWFNHAQWGTKPWGYHAVNVWIHICAGLALYGVARRTLLNNRVPIFYRRSADLLAAAIALLWLLHPLQTESVTYVIQRAESLMGLLYLLTLYAFIRGSEAETGSRAWFILSIIACALGMATKEVMGTAPILILLYDRVFLSGSLRIAFKRRGLFYGALAATWIVLGALAVKDPRLQSVVVKSIGPLEYAFNQPWVILHYLWLAFVPHPLILDYSMTPLPARQLVLPLLIVLALLAIALLALRRRPFIGFLAVLFFLILAPTSSFMPLVDLVFEHRMYLPLAALIALIVLGLYALLHFILSGTSRERSRIIAFIVITSLAGTALGTLTFRRNRDYRSEISIFESTVRHQPKSARAHVSLGNAFQAAGKNAEALAHFREAVEINPDYAGAYNNAGILMLELGKLDRAETLFREAARSDPNFGEAYNNLGTVLAMNGRIEDAIGFFKKAVELEPNNAVAHRNIGNYHAQSGKPEEAMNEFQTALKLDPNDPQTHNNIGILLAQSGKQSDAIFHFARAVQLDPNFTDARTNLETARQAAAPQ